MAHPFLFINHGKPMDIYSFHGEGIVGIWFRDPVPKQIAGKIEKNCPKSIKGKFLLSNKFLINQYYMGDEEEDKMISRYMKQGNFALESSIWNRNEWKKHEMIIYQTLADDIESWALASHQIAPIYLFIGINHVTGSAWDDWSIKYADEIADNISQSWGKSKLSDIFLHEIAIQLLQRKNVPQRVKKKLKKFNQP